MKEQKWINRILLVAIVLFSFLGYKGISIYRKAFRANIFTNNKKDYILLIPSGTNYESLLAILDQKLIIKRKESFIWTATKKNLSNHINPGRYEIKNRMSNNDLVNLIRSGKQKPVKVTFNNIRTLPDLAKSISKQIEPDKQTLLHVFTNDSLIESYGFSQHTVIAMFIPNTYEFYWNTSAISFFHRMYNEYSIFWTKKRIHKAEQIPLSEVEVITLASIVDEETLREDEMPAIAGVYINRLKKNIRLQADPTVKYANRDFTIKRVLNKHLRANSPYNTYRHGGLPPGPISIPSITAIDAVLNYENHNYYYFCAKEDFSGYHRFARTNQEHNRNRALYQKALNKRRIYR